MPNVTPETPQAMPPQSPEAVMPTASTAEVAPTITTPTPAEQKKGILSKLGGVLSFLKHNGPAAASSAESIYSGQPPREPKTNLPQTPKTA